MLQLICHHTYDTWDGQPVDFSAYGRSNGTNLGAEFLPDGAAAGSGALEFERRPGAGPRVQPVQVPVSQAWRELGAIRVEVLVNPNFLNPIPTTPRILVFGAGSFILFDKFPEGLFGGLSGADGLPAEVVTSGPPHSPDGGTHLLPDNRWTSVRFSYDGFSRLELGINGVVVGRVATSLPLQPVGPPGLSIGADHNGGFGLRGRIDELKVWRRDPDSLRRQFLCRPHDRGVADCWAAVFRAVDDAARAHPARMGEVTIALDDFIKSQLRRAARTDPAAQAALRDILARYARLWCRGALDSDEMQSVFRDLFKWWRTHAGGGPADDKLQPIQQELVRLLGSTVDLRCDPAFRGFLRRIAAAAQT